MFLSRRGNRFGPLIVLREVDLRTEALHDLTFLNETVYFRVAATHFNTHSGRSQ